MRQYGDFGGEWKRTKFFCMIYVLKTYEAFVLRPFSHVYVLTVLDTHTADSLGMLAAGASCSMGRCCPRTFMVIPFKGPIYQAHLYCE